VGDGGPKMAALFEVGKKVWKRSVVREKETREIFSFRKMWVEVARSKR
jgi:hypothetical protein